MISRFGLMALFLPFAAGFDDEAKASSGGGEHETLGSYSPISGGQENVTEGYAASISEGGIGVICSAGTCF